MTGVNKCTLISPRQRHHTGWMIANA